MRGRHGPGRFAAWALAAALVLAGGSLGATAEPAGAAVAGFNGRIAFASRLSTGPGVNNPEGDWEIFTMNPNGSDVKQLTFNGAGDLDPAWSPNGQTIAFVTTRDSSEEMHFTEIYTMRADGANQKRLTNSGNNGAPAWSADGKKIAFVSQRDGNPEVYTMDADGSGQRNLTKNPAIDTEPTWSSSGGSRLSRIAFSTRRDGNLEIYSMRAKDGTNQVNLTNNPAIDISPAWSTGRRIAFVSDRDGDFDIFAMGTRGKATNLSNSGDFSSDGADFSPVWSPSGDQIAFVSNRDGNTEIYTMDQFGGDQTNRSNSAANDDSPDWQVKRR
jgi:Tol biopolymer transport system component